MVAKIDSIKSFLSGQKGPLKATETSDRNSVLETGEVERGSDIEEDIVGDYSELADYIRDETDGNGKANFYAIGAESWDFIMMEVRGADEDEIIGVRWKEGGEVTYKLVPGWERIR